MNTFAKIHTAIKYANRIARAFRVRFPFQFRALQIQVACAHRAQDGSSWPDPRVVSKSRPTAQPKKRRKKEFLKVKINICHVLFFGGRGIGPNLTFHTPPFFGISSFVVVVVVGGISRGWTGEKKQEITLLVQAN